MRTLLLSILLVSFSVSAKSINLTKYKKGSGSEYSLTLDQGRADVRVYVANSSAKSLTVEVHINAKNELLPIELWQQFKLKHNGSKMQVESGYVQSELIGSKPQQLPSNYLRGYNDGVKMDDFLMGAHGTVPGAYQGEEQVSVKAGTVKAKHFIYSSNGQTIHYWISPEAKPFGLVKIVSQGKKKDQNYTLELGSLIKNMPKKINPNSAVPLNKNGRSFLPSVGADLFTN